MLLSVIGLDALNRTAVMRDGRPHSDRYVSRPIQVSGVFGRLRRQVIEETPAAP
jgi:hypothetical protein